MNPAILQTVDIQLFRNMGLLHTELQYRRRKIRLSLDDAHQCLISSKQFPREPPYYIHSTKPTKSPAFRLLRL